MDETKPIERDPVVPLEYRSALSVAVTIRPVPVIPADQHHWHRPGRSLSWLKWTVGAMALLTIVGSALVAYDYPRRAMALREECGKNFRILATASIAYADAYDGKRPASFDDLMLATGLTPDVFVCPATGDTPAQGSLQEQPVANGGHVSYIWLGKNLPIEPSADTVLAYEPLANHNNAGIHVLFTDYHIEWLDTDDAKKLIDSILPGERVVWPTPSSKP